MLIHSLNCPACHYMSLAKVDWQLYVCNSWFSLPNIYFFSPYRCLNASSEWMRSNGIHILKTLHPSRLWPLPGKEKKTAVDSLVFLTSFLYEPVMGYPSEAAKVIRTWKSPSGLPWILIHHHGNGHTIYTVSVLVCMHVCCAFGTVVGICSIF